MSRLRPAFHLPRTPVVETLKARVVSGPPVLLGGPPGAGKTTLLREVGAQLEDDGWTVVYLDLMGAASSPERFVAAALEALPASRFGTRLAEATRIRGLAGSGRAQAAAAVEALFALWAALDRDETTGGPVALLLDEVTEVRSLAYFKGLREADRMLGTALLSRRRGTLLASSYPTLARRLWPALEGAETPPVSAPELSAALDGRPFEGLAEALARAGAGLPRYLRPLVEGLADGLDLLAVWADEMAPGGRLEQACRHTYETLLLRSRGYGMSKAVLAAVAHEEGLNLTALVARLGRTPGAVRDYLGWLVGVDALQATRKRYFYVDALLRRWVQLHTRGTPPGEPALRLAAREAVGEDVALAIDIPSANDEPLRPTPFFRVDPLIEID